MHHRPLFTTGTAGTAALLIGCLIACSDSTSPGTATSTFDTQVSADLAPSAGEDVSADYAFYSSASGAGDTAKASFSFDAPATNLHVAASRSVPTSASAAWISPACAFDLGTHFFDCSLKVAKNGHLFSVTYKLFDSTGAVQQTYNKFSTDSIQFIVGDTALISYSFNGNTFADTVRKQRSATVSGLKGNPDTVHTWNATGSGSIMSVRSGQITKIYTLLSTDTTTDVRIKQPRGINPYPLSGTIIRNYTITRDRLASDTTHYETTRRVVVTFNGTANVPMMIGSDSYMLNLDTRIVTKQ